ncbi:hypothetical protein [Yoonia algicola]|uniref:Uncharacterized protein n=1 Tax=Yoonia algicola TaxID=3137368 RepID=A0AAN0MF28_9RHOB
MFRTLTPATALAFLAMALFADAHADTINNPSPANVASLTALQVSAAPTDPATAEFPYPIALTRGDR